MLGIYNEQLPLVHYQWKGWVMSEVSIPEGWNLRKYGEIVSIQYGKSPKDIKSDDGNYPIIGTGGFVGLGTDYLYDGQSIVIGRKGTIDKPTFIEGRFWAIDTTYYTDSYKNTDPQWFYYRVLFDGLSKYNEATGVPSLNRDTLYSIEALTPPLPEQQKIASILTSVDDVIEKTQSQIKKLQDLKKGTMNELLTRGIGHTEFKDSPVGWIPREWEVKTVGEIVSIQYGKSPKDIKSDSGEYPIVGTGGVASFGTDFLYDGESIIIGRKGTIDKPTFIYGKFWAIDTTYFTTSYKNIIPKWFYYRLIYEGLSKYNEATGVPSLSRETLYLMQSSVPSLSEQKKIASILSSIDKTIEEKQRKLEQTKFLKKSLMNDLLTGKVRVSV